MGKWNKEAAKCAKEAMQSIDDYNESLSEGDPYTAVKYLVVDLMHYCDQEGIDWYWITEDAEILHDGEVADDE